MFNTHNSYYVIFALLTNKNYSMKIYCLSSSTDFSACSELLVRRIVSKSSAIDDFINVIKERMLASFSENPYYSKYPVFVSVLVRQPDDNGVFIVVDRFSYRLQLNTDSSIDIILIR